MFQKTSIGDSESVSVLYGWKEHIILIRLTSTWNRIINTWEDKFGEGELPNWQVTPS